MGFFSNERGSVFGIIVSDITEGKAPQKIGFSHCSKPALHIKYIRNRLKQYKKVNANMVSDSVQDIVITFVHCHRFIKVWLQMTTIRRIKN